MNLIITNISQLITLKGKKKPRVGKELSEIGIIKDSYLFIKNGKIENFGYEKDIPKEIRGKKDLLHIDAAKRVVMPAFVDCHTHSLFAKPRLDDFEARLLGFSYLEIKKRGGGINLSAKHIKETSYDELVKILIENLTRFVECGTTTIEIKSGYGLDFENEIKMLEVIKSSSLKTDVDIIPTFLGAHSIPNGFTSKEYIQYLKEKLIPYISQKKLAVFADIFCEKGYFDIEESIDYLNYAKRYNLLPRIHADQLTRSGGSIVAGKVKAISADHLDWANDKDIDILVKNGVFAVFLPSSNYFTGLEKYPDARSFIEKGSRIAISTDFNPGTSPCWNMQFVISLALIKMKMRIEEAITASTYNPACLLGMGERVGMIEKGMDANLIILDVKDYRELGYYFGSNINWITIKKGKVIYDKEKKYKN